MKTKRIIGYTIISFIAIGYVYMFSTMPWYVLPLSILVGIFGVAIIALVVWLLN